MKKILVTLLFTIFSLTMLFSFNSIVLASDTISNLNKSATEGYGNNVVTDYDETTIPSRIGTIVGSLLAFIGVLFMGLIIYGGFIWMTARGNEAEAKKAKDIIIDATIGLVIVLAAYAITAFIGGSLGQ